MKEELVWSPGFLGTSVWSIDFVGSVFFVWLGVGFVRSVVKAGFLSGK